MFAQLFKHQRKWTRVLISVDARSIAGAYACYAQNELPKIIYEKRLPIVPRAGEPATDAMLRALNVLGEALTQEGAAASERLVGSSQVSAVVVSVGSPWQETHLRRENLHSKAPFVFTHTLAQKARERAGEAPPGTLRTDDCIVGVSLNGYHTDNPYGKKGLRASILILTSFINQEATERMRELLGQWYAARHIRFVAGSAMRYRAVHAAFPHEENALVLDADESGIMLALIRNKFLSATADIPWPIGTAVDWTEGIRKGFADLAERYPLPQTIFLLAPEALVEPLQRAIEDARSGLLWFADGTPHIVVLRVKNLLNLVTYLAPGDPDPSILLLAHFARTGEGPTLSPDSPAVG